MDYSAQWRLKLDFLNKISWESGRMSFAAENVRTTKWNRTSSGRRGTLAARRA
jgi:hypothetical protein